METHEFNDTVSSDMSQMMPDTPAVFGNTNDVSSRQAAMSPRLPNPFTPTIRPDNCINCGNNFRPNNNMIFWTWGTFPQFFPSNMAVSHVRFYNASRIREPLDIYLNNRLVLSNLEPMRASGFLHITPGFYRLTIYRRGILGAPVINGSVRFAGGNSYLLTILGTANNASIRLTNQ